MILPLQNTLVPFWLLLSLRSKGHSREALGTSWPVAWEACAQHTLWNLVKCCSETTWPDSIKLGLKIWCSFPVLPGWEFWLNVIYAETTTWFCGWVPGMNSVTARHKDPHVVSVSWLFKIACTTLDTDILGTVTWAPYTWLRIGGQTNVLGKGTISSGRWI